MKLNDTLIRAILGLEKEKGNCIRFEADYCQLKALALLGQLDLNECQNESPSIGEFLEFFESNKCSQEEVVYEGYYVTPERDDTRVSIEGIQLNIHLSSQRTKDNFINRFRQADEFDMRENHYRAWWD